MFVYKITHIASGKVYIGQTTGTIANRWKEHCKGYKQPNSHLHRAITKYGAPAFTVEQLATADTLEELNALEERYIAELGTLSPVGYNLLPGGNNRRHHPETRAVLSEMFKGNAIPNRWNKGNPNPCAESTKQQIAAKLKGRPIKNRQNGAAKGRPVSAEHRANISKTMTGVAQPWKYKPVQALETGVVYESVKAAAVAVGIDRVTIMSLLKSGKRGRCGLSFVYVTKK